MNRDRRLELVVEGLNVLGYVEGPDSDDRYLLVEQNVVDNRTCFRLTAFEATEDAEQFIRDDDLEDYEPLRIVDLDGIEPTLCAHHEYRFKPEGT